MQQRHSINKGGAHNWVGAHKTVIGVKTPVFGVRDFRKHGFATEDVKDAAAEREINKGYSKKKNPLCGKCNVMVSRSGACMCD